MALNLAKELDPYFISPPEWKNEGHGYSLVREGVGRFGQHVRQSFNHEYQSFNVEEIFRDGPAKVKRRAAATVDKRDPDRLYRSSAIGFLLPKFGAIVTVHSPEGSKDIVITADAYQGTIENAPLSYSGIVSPAEFRYNPKRLVKMTLQGEFVPFSDPTPSNLSLSEGLPTLISVASAETPDRVELYKKNAQEDLERSSKNFDPDGEEIKAVDAKVAQLLGKLINALPAEKASAGFKLLDALGFKEKLKAGFLRIIPFYPQRQGVLEGLDLEEVLVNAVNLEITTLGIYSRKTSRRWLEVDRIKPGSFRFRDFDEEMTTEAVEGKDYDTGETRKEFRGVAHKSRKALGRVPYGSRIPVLDYNFRIGREGVELSAHAFTRGKLKWSVDKIPYKLPAANIKTLLTDPLVDPTSIKLYVPIQPYV